MSVMKTHSVVVRKRQRKVNNEKVDQLAKSMGQLGMINAITVNANTLIAGAHRLAAAKQLGWEWIDTCPMATVEDKELQLWLEIDENLIRNELSAAERAEHIAIRIKLIAKRKMPEKLKEVAKAKVDSGAVRAKAADDTLKSATLLGNVCLKVSHSESQNKITKGAERAAKAEAIKETATATGIQETHIRKAASDHEAVTKAGLDQNQLEELSGVQYKRVATVARTNPQAAQEELEEQLTKPGKLSSVDHDRIAYIRTQISTIQNCASALKREKFLKMLNLSELEKGKIKDLCEDIGFVVNIVKSKL